MDLLLFYKHMQNFLFFVDQLHNDLTPYHPLTHSFLIKPLAVSLANPLLGFAMLGAFSKANAKAFPKAHAFSKADAIVA